MKKTTIALCFALLPLALGGFASGNEKCASCHGKDGKGKSKQGERMEIADMTSADFKKAFPIDQIHGVMTASPARRTASGRR